MHPDSICRLCVDPSKCPLCDVMRNPRPLTMRSIATISTGRCAPAPRVTRTVDAAQVGLARVLADEAQAKRNAALRAAIEATKAEIARLSARRSVGLHPMPAPTVPPAVPLAPLAPAPAHRAPSAVLGFGPLKVNDWAGLAARVDAGILTKAAADAIGSEWMNAFQGVSARA